MEYSEKTLGKILKDMYENAPKNEQILMINLFGVKFGSIIKLRGYNAGNIVRYAGLSNWYRAEVSKGVKLSKYVVIKESQDKLLDRMFGEE